MTCVSAAHASMEEPALAWLTTFSASVKVAGQESGAIDSMILAVVPTPVYTVPATHFWEVASTANVCQDTRVSCVRGGMPVQLTVLTEPCSAMNRVGSAIANMVERHVEMMQLCQLLPVPAVQGRVQTMPLAGSVNWTPWATYVPAHWAWWALAVNMMWMNVWGTSALMECSA